MILSLNQEVQNLKQAAVTLMLMTTNLPAFTVEFDNPFFFMWKFTHKLLNEVIIFSVYTDRKVIG